MMFSFAGMNQKTPPFPINITPFQRQDFAGASQAAVAGEGHDCPPIRVRASIENPLRILSGNELLPVALNRRFAGNFRKRIDRD
ncbi:MAG: hypothetical protein IT426_13050 [Pirellulales bacterium]|nr:hypothetical protein [Pirellulales bacterium]